MRYIHHCIAVGRSDHPEWPPQQVLDWHIADGYWYSSTRQPGILINEIVPVRYVPGSNLIGLARFVSDFPEQLKPQDRPEPDLAFRWKVEWLNAEAVEGVRMSEFGIDRTRLRRGLIGLTAAEFNAIEVRLAGHGRTAPSG